MSGVPGMARRALAPAAALALLAGCAQQPQVARPAARVYAVDLQGGAKVCTVPAEVALSAERPAEVRMVVGNDGGWCGISVSQPGPKPFSAGLVTDRPSHGRVHIRTVGDVTRVDYIPDQGFAGEDAFAVRLLPGGAQMRVAVTVQPGPASVTPAAAAPAAPPAARTPPAAPAGRASPPTRGR